MLAQLKASASRLIAQIKEFFAPDLPNTPYTQDDIYAYDLINKIQGHKQPFDLPKPAQHKMRKYRGQFSAREVRRMQSVMVNRTQSITGLAQELGVSVPTIYTYVAPDGSLRKSGKRVIQQEKQQYELLLKVS